MPSTLHGQPTVVLAVNSPLYAPVLLAKAENLENCRQIRIELGLPPQTATTTSTPRDQEPGIDPFINRVLAKTNVAEQLLIGIGDPMRLTSIGATNTRYHNPVVKGVLITKMCYWIITYEPTGDNWVDAFQSLLVHPQGMTGYTLPCYDLLVALNRPYDPKKLHHEGVDPNNERELYEALMRIYRRKNKRRMELLPSAFLTPNPAFVVQAEHCESRLSPIRSFLDRRDQHGDTYRNAVMTALIVAEPFADDERVAHFKTGVARAIECILNDPERAGFTLYRAFMDGLVVHNAPAHFALAQPDVTIGRCLRCLAELRVFNEHEELLIDSSTRDNSIMMRQRIENEEYLPLVYWRRSATELASVFSCVLS